MTLLFRSVSLFFGLLTCLRSLQMSAGIVVIVCSSCNCTDEHELS